MRWRIRTVFGYEYTYTPEHTPGRTNHTPEHTPLVLPSAQRFFFQTRTHDSEVSDPGNRDSVRSDFTDIVSYLKV